MPHIHDLEQENAAYAVLIERMNNALHTAHNALLIAKSESYRLPDKVSPHAMGLMIQTADDLIGLTIDPALDETLAAIQGAYKTAPDIVEVD